VKDEQLRGKKRVVEVGQRGNREIRREQHQASDGELARHFDGDAGSEGVSEEDDVSGLNAGSNERVDAGAAVVVEAGLGGLTGQSAVATIFDCEEAVAGCDVGLGDLGGTV